MRCTTEDDVSQVKNISKKSSPFIKSSKGDNKLVSLNVNCNMHDVNIIKYNI